MKESKRFMTVMMIAMVINGVCEIRLLKRLIKNGKKNKEKKDLQ